MDKYFGIYVQALLAKDASVSLQKQLKNIKDLQVTVTPNFGKINSSEVTRINKELQTQLKDKLADAGKVDIKINSKPEEIAKTTQAVDDLSKSMKSDLLPAVKETGNGMGEFTTFSDKALNSLDGLLGIVGKVAIWSLATNAIFGTKRAISELFQSYVQIEDKLVSIARVSDGFDMDKIFQGAYKSSQQYGASLMDMLNATEEIARSYNYLNEEQVLAAATAGILASTIAEMDAQEAVGTIIAVSNAYGLAIENGERLIDMANEVDNNFSVTAQTIATAWERSAATAKTFGVEIQNLTGYIAAISTVTQESGSVIGNSLKTIFSRITTMDAARDAITEVGVAIEDTSGNVRDTQDIIADLADKWDGLTAAQQQNLGVQVAGRYQLTRFLALMNNWEIATKASATALASEGGAARENAIYMDSYTAKLIRAENAQAALAEAINNSSIQDMGKTFIDLKTTITEFAAGIFRASDATVIFGVALIGLVSALSKTANGQKIVNQVTGLFISEEQRAANAALKAAQAQNQQVSGFTKLKNAIFLKTAALSASNKAVDKYNAATKASERASQLLDKANKVERAGYTQKAASLRATATEYQNTARSATVAATGFKAAGIAAQVAGALIQAAFTLGIGIVIGMITNALMGFINANKEATASTLENVDAMNERQKSLEDNKISIKGYQDTLHSSTATTEDMEAAESSLLDIQGELISKYGEKAKKLDLINGKYEDQIKLISDLEQEDAKKWLRENRKGINIAEEKLSKDTRADVYHWGSGTGKQIDAYKGMDASAGLNSDYRINGAGNAFIQENMNAKEQIKYWSDLSDYMSEHREEVMKTYGLDENLMTEMENDVSSTINELNEKFGDHIKILDEAKEQALHSSDAYKNFSNGLLDLADDGIVTKEEIENLVNSQDGLIEKFEDAGITMDDLIKKYEIKSSVVSDAANSNLKYIETEAVLNEEITKLNENLDNMQNAYNTVASAIEEYNKSGYLSIDTMQQLLALDERYLTTLINERGELVLNEQSYRNMADAMLDEAEAAAYNQAMLDMETLSLNANKAEVEAVRAKYVNLSTQLQDTTAKYYDLAKAVATYKDTAGVSEADKGVADNIQKSLDAKLNVINKARLSLDKSVAKTVGSGSSSSSAAKQAAKYYEEAEKRLLAYKSAVEAVDNELKILQEQQKRNTEGSQAWFDNFKAQEKVVAKYQSSIKTYIAQLEKERASTKLTSEEKQKLTNKIEDLRLEYEKLNTTLYNNIEAQKDYYKDEIKNKLKLIQELEKTRHKEALDNIKKERKAFQDQIKEQLALMKKASAARSYEQDLNELQEKRLEILSKISRLEGDNSRLAQSQLKDLYDELKDVEGEIADLNYDRSNELREDALDDLSNVMDNYYDELEEAENKKNELILSQLEDAEDALKDLNVSLEDLIKELGKWTGTLSNFSTWAQTFDNLIGTMPSSNIVSAMIPVTSTNADGTTTTTSLVFNITGSSADGQNISDTIVDNLIKAGLITTTNP